MGIFSSIFGAAALKKGNKQALASQTEAYDKANVAFDPYAKAGQQALPAYMNAIGLGDSQAGIDSFQNSPLYKLLFDAQLKSGQQGVANMGNAAGMRNSGRTLLALQNKAAETANNAFGNYVNPLAGMNEMGLGVAGKKADLALGQGNANANYFQNKAQIKAGQMAGFDGLLSDAIKMAGNFVMPGSSTLY